VVNVSLIFNANSFTEYDSNELIILNGIQNKTNLINACIIITFEFELELEFEFDCDGNNILFSIFVINVNIYTSKYERIDINKHIIIAIEYSL